MIVRISLLMGFLFVAKQLNIQPSTLAGCYDWQLTCGDNGQDKRPSLLKPVDTALLTKTS
jgi:hypothetical protein